MDNIIRELTKVGKNYYEGFFHFKNEANLFIAKSNIMSYAINNRKNETKKVKVINWFDDLWSYIEIKFIPKSVKKKIIPSIFFSLSIFQGDDNDEHKTQLFRAEWDNHFGQEDSHSQPHWHIYPYKQPANIHQSFEDFLDLSKSDKDFLNYIYSETNNNYKIININKFHFAMNAQWADNKSDVHTISVESDLINWFKGLLNHLKKELKYAIS